MSYITLSACVIFSSTPSVLSCKMLSVKSEVSESCASGVAEGKRKDARKTPLKITPASTGGGFENN